MPLPMQATIQRLYAKNGETLFRINSVALVIGGTFMAIYALWGMGIHLHFDEWVGRGLYPAIAMGHGADLYEPKSGPHITLYGASSALFYLPTALASDPTGAIWIAFLLNLLGLLGPMGYLLYQFLSAPRPPKATTIFTTAGLSLLTLGIFVIEPTTEAVFRIHADLPAFFFLFLALCFFHAYLDRNRRLFLYVACFSLALSAWAKLPTLPATLFPFLFLCLRGRFRDAFLFLPCLGIAFAVTTVCFTILYGWEDTTFILYKHIAAASVWAKRNELFGGPNLWIRMSYFEAIPLLFRYLIMYLAEYWYIMLPSITAFVLALRTKNESHEQSLFLNLCLIYALTLPPCLAALAHFGGVEYNLLFANGTGILLLLCGGSYIASRHLSARLQFAVTWGLAIVMMIPFVRLSKSAPTDLQSAPHQQALNYLRSGKTDVYFGWYPLSHIFHSGEIFSSIEIPTWVGMTRPDEIDFSIRHFPPKAKYLAMGPTSYGSEVLKHYLGELKEAPTPPELSSWRLYEPVEGKKP